MKVKYDSRSYKVAYWWKDALNLASPAKGEKINGCSFFWHSVAGVTIGPIMVAIIYMLLFLFTACAYGILFWVAKKPGDIDNMENGCPDIVWIPRILGHKVWPLSVLVACGAIYGIFLFVANNFLAVIGFLICFLVVALLSKAIPWEIISLYIKARKERYCPIVEIQ
jgi:hypothetical protein